MIISFKNQSPYSQQFDDIYFSTTKGFEEASYVFLNNSGLKQRLASQLSTTICELGFGTGLNFVTTWQAWEQAGCKGILHFISIEKYPLTTTEITKVGNNFSNLNRLFKQLVTSYPDMVPGFHHRHFAQGRVQLTLIHMDVVEALRQLLGIIDVWFLDGFSPAKNPQMWQPKIFELMAQHSDSHTTYSSFTAATKVRSHLETNGFTCKRIKGFEQKRHMICGQFTKSYQQHLPTWLKTPKAQELPCKVSIIGAGVAGITCAYQLMLAGYDVTVWDSHKVAANASGNPLGIIQPYLNADFCEGAQFIHHGFALTKDLIRQNSKIPQCFNGVLQLANKPHLQRRLQSITKNPWSKNIVTKLCAHKISSLIGIDSKYEGLLYPNAGVFSPVHWLDDLIQSAQLNIKTGVSINNIKHTNNGLCQLFAKEKIVDTANIVIISAGNNSHNFISNLPMGQKPGQVTLLEASTLSSKLKMTVCYDGYITPAIANNHHLVGATFRQDANDKQSKSSDDYDNIKRLYNATGLNNTTIKDNRTSTRATTSDHLPLVGPLTTYNAFKKNLTKTNHNDNKNNFYSQNLYISSGHGSKGLHTALLSASTLVHLLQAKALPISYDSYQAIHPMRFWWRQLKKQGHIKL